MFDQDKKAFKELMDATSEYYQREPLSKMALQMYFAALSHLSFEQVREAINIHVQRKGGQFYPKASDIIAILEGGEVTHDQIIAEARLKRTPFGVLCAIEIGSWDLHNQTDMFYLKQRAEECLQLLPEWKARALAGEYTDHEISIMLKHGVDPVSPFQMGLPAPVCAPALAARAQQVAETPRHRFLLEAPHQEQEGDKALVPHESVKQFIAEAMG